MVITCDKRLAIPENTSDGLILRDGLLLDDIKWEHDIVTSTTPTIMDFDNEQVKFGFTINTKTGFVGLFVRNQEIELLENYGLHHSSRFDQCWVNACHMISESVMLCKGINVYLDKESNYTWKTGIGAQSFMTVHSKNCLVLMPFNSLLNNTRCTLCVHDIQ